MPSGRGEFWVILQLILLTALVFAPSLAPETWSAPLAEAARLLGGLIGALGG